ncbi:MAG: aldo/keto reductase [Ginsengibacter sp.]
MEKRKLGDTKIEVAPLALGGNVFGWTIGEKDSVLVLDEFVSKGYNFIDTADMYSRWKPGNSGGESETILGKWMNERKNRKNLIIATKVGADMGEGAKLSKGYILKSVENSLKRLQTDYIDLYQSHYDDLNTPVEETLEAFNTLITSGKVKAIGASNYSIERLKTSVDYSKANNLARYQTFQPEYNLYAREHFEKNYKEYCQENNVTVICYYSLASGFLTGKYRSEADLTKSTRGGGIKKYLNSRGLGILNALDEISSKKGVSQASLALAWLQAQTGIIPIASATNIAQLKELTDAAEITLSKDDLGLLNESSSY